MSFSLLRNRGEKRRVGENRIIEWIRGLDFGVIVVLGYMRSGKTAFSVWLAQNSGRHVQIFVPRRLREEAEERFRSVFDDFSVISSLKEIETGSFILVDESAIHLNARRSMSGRNVSFIGLNVIAGHKDAVIVYITQFARFLDLGDLLSAREYIFKRLGYFTGILERPALLRLLDHMATYGYTLERLQRLEKNEFVIIGEDFKRPRKFTNPLPRGWSDEVSKFMQNYIVDEGYDEELAEKIRELREEGLSYRQIARTLGITLWQVQKVLTYGV